LLQMPRQSDRKLKQVLPIEQLLPTMVDCPPYLMTLTIASGFHTTRWTLFQAAAVHPHGALRGFPTRARHAVPDVLEPGLRFHSSEWLRRGSISGPDPGLFCADAGKKYLAYADKNMERFRSFLLTAVKRFFADEWDRAHALKRGEGQVAVSIDLSKGRTGGMCLRWWRKQLLKVCLNAAGPYPFLNKPWPGFVRNSMLQGMPNPFERLSLLLNRDSDDVGCEILAAQMGMSSGALRMSVHRMRRKYRCLLRRGDRPNGVLTRRDR
jgi:hypothetical protein